ncbi:MAG TPA: DUF742 domain-containing protein [Actinomycetes bacterium]|jgi:hypothetical protein|nr:DUF742 domain-containing protein [Actinomycetes bacterium]
MSVIGERDPAQVRPYAMTAGRTHGGEGLAIETLVSITPMGRDLLPGLRLEPRAIALLCQRPLAVAEVAARLDVPLGVARVLVADLAADGLLTVQQPARGDAGDRPGRALLERVLDGLRAI